MEDYYVVKGDFFGTPQRIGSYTSRLVAECVAWWYGLFMPTHVEHVPNRIKRIDPT